MTTKIKICGITTLEDARYCAAAGADYLGFIQYPQSPRYIAPDAARDIIEWVYGPAPVGVFVNESPDVINRIAEKAGFSYIQLHGNESPEVCAKIERPVIKALQVVHDASSEQLRALMEAYEENVTYFLLDTFNTSLWGGTGESFNWRLARDLSTEYQIFLAGGINADNVADAVHTMHPFCIDVSSSLESAPGKKDFDKLAAFFQALDKLKGAPEERSMR